MSTNIKVQRICQYCGKEFTAKTTATKYCSHTCNSRHYKQKVKGVKIEKSDSETLKIKGSSIIDVKVKDILTVRDVAILLSCSVRTAYRLVNNGTIAGVNLAERMTRISKNELHKILENPKPTLMLPQVKEFDTSDYYTINEVQEKYGISQTGLQLLIKKHNIPKTKKGKYTYVPKSVINGLLT